MSISQIPQQPPRSFPVLNESGGFTSNWVGWFQKLTAALNGNINSGFSGTITTAKLTNTGATGSMVFKNGILVSETAAT